MRKWQILEFDDKPFYAFVPENVNPFENEEIPEYKQDQNDYEYKINKFESINEENLSNSSINDQEIYFDNEEYLVEEDELEEEEEEEVAEEIEEEDTDIKPIILNDYNKENDSQNVFEVNVGGRMITIQKVNFSSELDVKNIENEIIDDNEKNNEKIYIEDSENFENKDDDSCESFLDENELEIKNFTETKNSSILKCKICSETFDSPLSFRKHVAWTHKKKICIQENGAFICSVCDYRTLKKSSFVSHLERKHETWSNKPANSLLFPCAACGFVCSSKHSLQSHFIRKHTDKYEHQCKFCSKKFKVKGDLTNHIRFHHKERPVSCEICGKLCQNSGSLYVHQKWAHFKPKFECHICHRRMVTQENLNQHLISQHEKREKIVCAECGKTFTKKDSFKRHMAVHTGSKPHSCMICAKNFARRSQLRQHLLIHTGKKPFVCDICGKSFAQKPGLICHRKTHPGNHPPLPVMPIGDLVKELTDEFEFHQDNVNLDINDSEEMLDEPEILNGEEIFEGEEILEGDEILEGNDVLEDQEILQEEKVFYEHEIQFHHQTKYEVDQEFLDEEEFQEALGIEENQEIVETEIDH